MITQYTDNQLKQALAKMLPKEIVWHPSSELRYWPRISGTLNGPQVLDTELLHLCWMVEQQIADEEFPKYGEILCVVNGARSDMPDEQLARLVCSATWQQRTIALAKVKNIEIV